MFLLNKVRELGDNKLYEVVEFVIERPMQFRINTVDAVGLNQYMAANTRDFDIKDGLLLSRAETVYTKLFEDAVVDFNVTPNLFTLLIELVNKDAFFIPLSVFSPDCNYNGEEISNFANIRVSLSSMYVGFSILHNGGWASSKILYVEDNKLQQKSFGIAITAGTQIETCDLVKVGSGCVNGRECDYYEYTGELPIIGDVLPAHYLPVPLFNYLSLQTSRYANAFRFFQDIFEEKGIQPSSTEYDTGTPQRAVTIKPSIKNPSKERRGMLHQKFAYYDGTLQEFVSLFRLNTVEHYAFALLFKVPSLGAESRVYELMKRLRVMRGLHSLVLMMLRCQVFEQPQYFFPEHFNRIVAYGGGGGDDFITTIELNNY